MADILNSFSDHSDYKVHIFAKDEYSIYLWIPLKEKID